MSSAMMADIQKADEFKVVEKRWHDKFEKEAVKIVVETLEYFALVLYSLT